MSAACARSDAQTPVAPTPPEGEVWLTKTQTAQLRFAEVRPRHVDDVLRLGGRVAFDDQKVTHVYSPVNGQVTRVLAAPGEHVGRGQALALIASPDVGSAFSDLLKAKADLVTAQHQVTREKTLRAADAASAVDLENAQDNFLRAQAEYARANERARMLDRQKLNAVTQELTLRAPIAGEVISRDVHPGIEVQGLYDGGNAVELFTVGELDPVFVYADLHEQDLAQAHVGEKVLINVVAYPRQTFEGTIDLVSATLDPVLRTARLRIRLPNAERLLKPGMYATVTMPRAGPPELAVPREAVVHLGRQTVVYVAQGTTETGDARFLREPVGVDEDVTGDLCPVLRGLQAGQTVVTDGAILLSQTGAS